jgi:hypothetical protein
VAADALTVHVELAAGNQQLAVLARQSDDAGEATTDALPITAPRLVALGDLPLNPYHGWQTDPRPVEDGGMDGTALLHLLRWARAARLVS